MTVIDNPSLDGDSMPFSTSGPDPETSNERATGPEQKVRRRRFRLTRRRLRRRAVADRWVARAQRRRWWRLASVVLVVALIGGAVWAAWFSSLLAVRQVSVVGLSDEGELVGGQEVRSAASIPAGMPIARLDTASAQARVLELPWVASVEVRRAWPQDVVIAVTERSPVAVVMQGEERRGVDAEGNIFDPPGGLWLTDPIIRGDESAIAEAVKVASSLPADLEKRVRAIQAVSVDDIRLELGNKSIVRWGNAQEAEFKAEVLRSLLPRRAQAYDVSAPSLPATFGEKGPKK
jgi:cell division protein FtsQ